MSIVKSIQAIVGKDNVLTEPSDCWPYGYDNSKRHAQPDAVVFATTHDQILHIVQLCNQFKTPLITRGRGTGTTGATVPITGGIVLTLERMNQITELNGHNRWLIAEPGVTNEAIQLKAKTQHFFWPPDPTSAAFCTLGGNLAYNSAGPRAVKYGTTREHVLGLRAITGSGEEIRTGVFTTKGVVGYDLTRLLVGSEGTLAIITEATLKLTPLPEGKRTIRIDYANMESAAEAVSAIMAQPTTPCALEFIDRNAINMIREYSDSKLPDNLGAMLMVEVDGPVAYLDDMVADIKTAINHTHPVQFAIAQTSEEIKALWATRKALSPALRKVAPKKINEDVVVPVSNIPQLISGLDVLSKEHGIKIVNFGHAGNGNIHTNLLVDPDDPKQTQQIAGCLNAVFDLVLSLQGTLSGEHGVGLEKRDYIYKELSPTSLRLMHGIKSQFDPNNILNPDKMLPPNA
ncbi:MAG: FAD-binding protein [Methylococcales bacterium]|jgi:D-lactate dehydrogenase (quinone)|nr:FAD-binding protein [Methylococcales bacterium]MBT7445583.1 FAD-binding protein [Methylococcales bacterium]